MESNKLFRARASSVSLRRPGIEAGSLCLLVDIIYIVASMMSGKASVSPMAMRLHSIDHAPAKLPIWELILEDLGHPSPHRIAKVLGVGVSTVYRWNSTGRAPRSAQLALFWLTRWGRSMVHQQAEADAIAACGYVASLRREIDRLEGNVRHLAKLSSGAVNDPLTRLPLDLAETRHLGPGRLGGPR